MEERSRPYRTPRKWLLLILIVAGAFSIAVLREKEPTFEGNNLTYWIHHIDSNTNATRAIEGMGVDCIPFLVSIIAYEEPWYSKKIRAWFPNSKYRTNPKYTWAFKLNAVDAFKALGPNGRPALPKLSQLLQSDEFYVAYGAMAALEHLGDDAVPALCDAIENSRHDQVRSMAALSFSRIKPQSSQATASLVKALQDKSYAVRQHAALSLGEIRLYPEISIPALIELLDDRFPRVRGNSIGALHKHGSAATSAIPKLRQALKDQDANVASSARGALLAIAPEQSKDLIFYCELCKEHPGWASVRAPRTDELRRLCKECFNEHILTPTP